ncbi:kinase-like domain-containing protein [Ustulina deusta]|nr:kinase-like domain-containing protein [Ustulina deusta]
MSSRGASQLAQQIQGYFSASTSWQYEKLLGYGSFGLAILVSQKGAGPSGLMVVKVALNSIGTQLRNEISWLKQLNGAMHIVRMIASVDPERPKLDNNRRPPVAWVFDPLVRLRGPVLAMEYINGGDLTTLFRKILQKRGGAHMPNRILWSLYLCLIRACIGMAYPVGAPLTSTASTLETIRPGKPPLSLKHNDIALRNVMVGTARKESEHSIGHIFKLIDFGLAKNEVGGSSDNLFRVTEVVASFICMNPSPTWIRPELYKGFETSGAYLLPRPERNPYPWLDPDLSGLMAECMYTDRARRPSLQQALSRAQHAVLNKTSNMFPNPDQETDEAIKDFVQQFILNAN